MSEREPDPLTLKSAKYFFHEGRLQIELSDARILRIEGLPRLNLPASLLEPPGFTATKAVEQLMGTPEAQPAQTEATPGEKEKQPVVSFTGKLLNQAREGRPDQKNQKTAWGKFAAHQADNDRALMLSATFYNHTASKALTLPTNARLTIQGYHYPSEDPARMDIFRVFTFVHHTGSE